MNTNQLSPTISIITVVYNANATLELSIKSVISQKNDLHEYIIVDGCSTDGSLETIYKYQNEITKLISEPDKGIYDAMNKGIDLCTGEWLYFLGADDILNNGILEDILPKLKTDTDVVYGSVNFDNGYNLRSHVGIRCFLENRVHHQSAFYNRRIFKNFRYNINYKISADYELTLRMLVERQKTLFVPFIIATCGTTGASSTISSQETNNIRAEYIKKPFLNYSLSYILNMYYSYFKMKIFVKRLLSNFRFF